MRLEINKFQFVGENLIHIGFYMEFNEKLQELRKQKGLTQEELDYLIYNAPWEYAELILNGDPETYLKTVTEHKPLD